MKEIDWTSAAAELDMDGFAILPGLLDMENCASLRGGWLERGAFRSEIVMARHGYGRGAYRYYAYPLPAPIATLRSSL